MTSQSIIQGIVLLLYLIAMVMVGFVFYKKNSTHSDYVLGGRITSSQTPPKNAIILLPIPCRAFL